MKPSIEAPIWSDEISVSCALEFGDQREWHTSCSRHDDQARPMVLNELSHCAEIGRESFCQWQIFDPKLPPRFLECV